MPITNLNEPIDPAERTVGIERSATQMPNRTELDVFVMDCTGDDIFIVFNGVKIAKRGHPGTPQAMTWVALEPGWSVMDGPNLDSIAIECDGVRVN